MVLLVGARQTGKSTLIQSDRFAKRTFLTFDDATTLSAAKSDPEGFLAGYTGAVTIDEVQRVPELFLAIKATVDHNRTAGRFLLSGSADVLFLPKLADSLAGRMEVLRLRQLFQGEIEGRRERFVDLVFGKAPLKLKAIP